MSLRDSLPRWLQVLLGIFLFALLTVLPTLATGLYLENIEIVWIVIAINII